VADNQRETGSRHAHCSFRLANIGIARDEASASVGPRWSAPLAIRHTAFDLGSKPAHPGTVFLWDLIHVILVIFVSCVFNV
jgi:hypothetical protein